VTGDRLGGGFEQLARDAAVGQEDDPLCVGGGDRVMRHHDDRLTAAGDQAAKESKNLT
jgi:hypothetical protein